jgi:hypothetical protein
MSYDYYDFRKAKVRIADELRKRDWKIYGYHEDQSDSMSDYYSPAYWDGIATKNGFVLCVDIYSTSDSGRAITRYNKTLAMTQDDREKITKLEAMTIQNGCTTSEEDNAKQLIEKIKAKTPNNVDPYEIIGYYPTFQNHPSKNCKWHIEKDGGIFDKGTGIGKYCSLPSSYEYDINKMEYTERYKQVWTDTDEYGSRIMSDRVMSEEGIKLISDFKSFILKVERIATMGNSCGDGTKETEQQAEKQNKPLEKVIIKKTKKEIKPVEITRDNFQVGDLVSFNYHSGYWIITADYMRSGTWKQLDGSKITEERRAFSYKGLGKKYTEVKNTKSYYQYETQLLEQLKEGKVKIYELQEVETVEEIEKYVDPNKKTRTQKANNATETTPQATTSDETKQEVNIINEVSETAETTFKPLETNNNITITINNELNGIEVSFKNKPSQNVLDELKNNGFRWHFKKFLWYAKQTADRLAFVQALKPDNEITGTDQAVKQSTTNNKTIDKDNILDKINKAIESLTAKIKGLSGDYKVNTWKRQNEEAGRQSKINSWEIDIKLLEHVQTKLIDNLDITELEKALTVGSQRDEIHSYYVRKYGRSLQDIKFPQIDHSLDIKGWYNLEVPTKQRKLHKMGITNTEQLNQAVDEYRVIYDSVDRYISPKTQQIKTLTNKYKMQQKGDIHFTDNKQLLDQLVELAQIETHHTVLEPSAGIGSIADKLKEYTNNLDVVEYNYGFAELLKLKDHNVVANDFLTYNSNNKYDRIVANVPFSDEQEHIKQIYNNLKDGGKAVIITSSHYTFASDRKSQDFRNWLDCLTHEVLEVPEKSFSHTNVNARILVIDKDEQLSQIAV